MGLSPKLTVAAVGAPAPAGLAVRLTATAILRQVIEQRLPLDSLLEEAHGNRHFLALETRDRALVRAIVGVALRRRGEIEAALAAVLDHKLPEHADALRALLSVAIAQILFLDVPDHAAVNLAVAQAGADRRTGRARGLVNAVLRQIARNKDGRPTPSPEINAPAWLYERWFAAYGVDTAERIAAAHLEPPPLDISVRSDPEGWAERLGGVALPTGSVRLAGTQRVTEIAGYDEGGWWVQDAAAALPPRLLEAVAGKRIADLCAAPGGKTAALAAAGADVTALDISATRMRRLSENLKRLGLKARPVVASILDWKPEERFDAVLLDAPCSATGTIRRHPDVAWLKQPEDIAKLGPLQAHMLDRAADWVRPEGTLLYCTCSLEPEEGEAQVAPFLAAHPDYELAPIAASEVAGLTELLSSAGTLRTLPCHGFGEAAALQGMDGFFAARFRRKHAA